MDKLVYSLANKFSLVVFTLLTIYSCWKIHQLFNLKYYGEVTKGIIIGYQTKKSNDYLEKNRKQIYAPIFTYKPKNKNTEVNISTSVYNEIKKYEIGDTVRVCYMKNKILKAQIKDLFPWRNKIYMLIVGVVGLIVTTLPFFKKMTHT